MNKTHIDSKELVLRLIDDLSCQDEKEMKLKIELFIHANAMVNLGLISEKALESDVGIVMQSFIDIELDVSEKSLTDKIIKTKLDNYTGIFFAALELLIDVKKSENENVSI